MGWYKKAFPVTNIKPTHYYDTIGHYNDRYSVPVLWAIGQSEKFYEYPAIDDNGDSFIHSTLTHKGIFPENPMATGRFDPNTKTCSVIYYYNKSYRDMNRNEQLEVQNKVARILDRIFKNPSIVVFDNIK